MLFTLALHVLLLILYKCLMDPFKSHCLIELGALCQTSYFSGWFGYLVHGLCCMFQLLSLVPSITQVPSWLRSLGKSQTPLHTFLVLILLWLKLLGNLHGWCSIQDIAVFLHQHSLFRAIDEAPYHWVVGLVATVMGL